MRIFLVREINNYVALLLLIIRECEYSLWHQRRTFSNLRTCQNNGKLFLLKTRRWKSFAQRQTFLLQFCQDWNNTSFESFRWEKVFKLIPDDELSRSLWNFSLVDESWRNFEASRGAMKAIETCTSSARQSLWRLSWSWQSKILLDDNKLSKWTLKARNCIYFFISRVLWTAQFAFKNEKKIHAR